MLRKSGEKFHMVHHGYQRPGHGYIVGDCFGVGHQPYEKSNEANIAYKPVLDGYLGQFKDRLDRLKSGKVTQIHTGIKKTPYVVPGDKEWESHLKSTISNVERQIRYIEQDISHNQSKIDDWKEKELPVQK
jgi:hypothetical protein